MILNLLMIRLFRLIECVMLGMFFGLVPLALCLLITLVVTAILFGTEVFESWVLWSFVPALAIDALFLGKWVRRAYQMNSRVLGLVYLFYSVVGLGMCMGIPIGALALGVAAGMYGARKMQLAGADEQARRLHFKKTASFCAAVMALICCLIALWAVVGGMIGYRIETPWRSLTLIAPLFAVVVLTGGAAAVLLQYWLTRISAEVMFRLI